MTDALDVSALGLTELRWRFPSRSRGQLLAMLEPGPCVSCDGHGWVEDPDGEQWDCPACEGTGEETER